MTETTTAADKAAADKAAADKAAADKAAADKAAADKAAAEAKALAEKNAKIAYNNVFGFAASLAAKHEALNLTVEKFIADQKLEANANEIRAYFRLPPETRERPASLLSFQDSSNYTVLEREQKKRDDAYIAYVDAFASLPADAGLNIIADGNRGTIAADRLTAALDAKKPRLEAINASLNAVAYNSTSGSTFAEELKTKAFGGDFSKAAYENVVNAKDWIDHVTGDPGAFFGDLYTKGKVAVVGATTRAAAAISDAASTVTETVSGAASSGAEATKNANLWAWAAGGVGALISFFVGRMFLGDGWLGTIVGGLLAFLGFKLGKNYVDGMDNSPAHLRTSTAGGPSPEAPCNDEQPEKSSSRGTQCYPLDPKAPLLTADEMAWVADPSLQNSSIAFSGPTRVSYVSGNQPGWTYTPRADARERANFTNTVG